MYRIVTVCAGNICRSPMAEYLVREAARDAGLDDVVVTSAGVSDEEQGNPIDPRARKVMERLGIDTSGHRARQVTREDLENNDLVLALDVPHYRALRTMAANDAQADKIHLMREYDPSAAGEALEGIGIYDPWYGDASDFDRTFGMIEDSVQGVIDDVARQPGSRREEP